MSPPVGDALLSFLQSKQVLTDKQDNLLDTISRLRDDVTKEGDRLHRQETENKQLQKVSESTATPPHQCAPPPHGGLVSSHFRAFLLLLLLLHEMISSFAFFIVRDL